MTTPTGGTGIAINLTPTPQSDIDSLKAETENAKKALAMIADSLKSADVSFVEQRSYAYDNRNPSKPALSHPLYSLRTAKGFKDSKEQEWQKRYQKLLDELPIEVLTWFKEQMNTTYILRDPNFYALHAFLVLTAEALVWFDAVSSPFESNSAQIERANQNLMVPYIAAAGIVLQSSEVVEKGQKLLHTIGPNDPNYDNLLGLFLQTSETVNLLKTILQDLADDKKSAGASKHLQKLNCDIKLIQEICRKTEKGEKFHILDATIDTLMLTISALTAGYGPSSVQWMLALGIWAPDTIHLIGNQLAKALIPSSNIGKEMLLARSLQTIMVLAASFILELAENGVAFLPKINSQTDSKIRLIILDTVVRALIDAGVLQSVTEQIAENATEGGKQKELIANSLQLAILALIPIMLKNTNDSNLLLKSLNPILTTLIIRIEPHLEKNEQARSLSFYMQQAKIALEKQDFEGFKSAFEGVLSSNQIDPNSLQDDFKEIKTFTTNLQQAVRKSPEDPTNHLTSIQSA